MATHQMIQGVVSRKLIVTSQPSLLSCQQCQYSDSEVNRHWLRLIAVHAEFVSMLYMQSKPVPGKTSLNCVHGVDSVTVLVCSIVQQESTQLPFSVPNNFSASVYLILWTVCHTYCLCNQLFTPLPSFPSPPSPIPSPPLPSPIPSLPLHPLLCAGKWLHVQPILHAEESV